MKKLDDFIENIDKQVDRKMLPWYKMFQKYFIFFSSAVFISLLFLIVFRLHVGKPNFLSSIIKADLTKIESILETIDKTCNILSLKEDRVSIDFLTVEKFAGSEVGGLNLAYPKKWKGPYVRSSISYQQRPYEIIRAYDGHFLLPGNGVELPNGYIVGRDFYITSRVAVLPLMQPGGYLFYKGTPLAIKIKFKIGDWDSPLYPTNKSVDDINMLLNEFNAAVPYSQNQMHTVQV